MSRRLLMPLAGLVVMVACADAPTGPDAGLSPFLNHVDEHDDDRHNGPVWVKLAFTIQGGGISPGVNQHPDGKGSCRKDDGTVSGNTADNTVWFNEQNKKTSAKFCEGSAGNGLRSCQAAGDNLVPATYAAGANDPTAVNNENLNFFSDEEGDVDDQFVHYKANADWTDARGVVNFSFTCGDGSSGQGSLALTQFATANPGGGNVFGPGAGVEWQLDAAGVVVVTPLGSGELASLSWVFRSRVGSS